MSIEPDTKDWTWVIEKACPDCGWDPDEVDRDQFADKLHETTKGWYAMLADADYAVRPAPHVWSRLEYACHVRDVHRLFAERVQRMLDEDNPTFDNWDQDATAEAEEYGEQEAAEVGVDLVERAAEAAAIYSRSRATSGSARAGVAQQMTQAKKPTQQTTQKKSRRRRRRRRRS